MILTETPIDFDILDGSAGALAYNGQPLTFNGSVLTYGN